MSLRFIPTFGSTGISMPIESGTVLLTQDQTADISSGEPIDESVDITANNDLVFLDDPVTIDAAPAKSITQSSHRFLEYPQKWMAGIRHVAKEIKAFFVDLANGNWPQMGPQILMAGALGVHPPANAAIVPDHVFMANHGGTGLTTELQKTREFFGLYDERELIRMQNRVHLSNPSSLVSILQASHLPLKSQMLGVALKKWVDQGMDLISLIRILPDNYLGLRAAFFDAAMDHHEQVMRLSFSDDGFQKNDSSRPRRFSGKGIHKLGSYAMSTDEGAGALYGNQDALHVSKRGAAIFDGVGGSSDGDKVSALAARVFQIMMEKNDSLIDIHDVAHAACHDQLPDGETTAVAFEIIGSGDKKKIVFVNNGDSGAMLLRKVGRTWKVVYETAAQSLVEERRRSNDLRVDDLEARAHPLGNIVTSVMGGEYANSNPVTHDPIDLKAGDIVLMASDGIWDNLSDAEITEILDSFPDLDATGIHQKITDLVGLKMQRFKDVSALIEQTIFDLGVSLHLSKIGDGQKICITGSSDCAGNSEGSGELMVDQFGQIYNSINEIVGMFLGTWSLQIGYTSSYLDNSGHRQTVYESNKRYSTEIPLSFTDNLRIKIPGEGDAYMDKMGRVFNSRGQLIDFYKTDNKTLYVGVVGP